MSLGGFSPIFLMPGKKKSQQRCERCGLYYDRDLEQCPHCSELNDMELADLQQQLAQRAQANRTLGLVFVTISVALAVLLLLLLG